MSRMTGCIGTILAVQLLGCTRICQMAPESRTVSLNRTYRTARTGRGQTGTRWTTNIRPAGEPRWAWIAGIGDLRKELRGPEVLEAIMAGVVVAVAIAVFLGGIVVGIIAVVAV